MLPTKPRILCVDNDEDNRFMLTYLLIQEGYRAKGVKTLEQAFELAQAESFDLYILESKLSDGSGIDLCLKIRESDARTPIVFYSGVAREIDQEEALRAGANAFVAKPYVEQLLETVRRMI